MSFWTDAAEATKNVVTEDDFEAARSSTSVGSASASGPVRAASIALRYM